MHTYLEGHTGEQQQGTQDRLQYLEKELFFYKSSSRELKKKLKDLVSGALHPGDPSHTQNCRQSHNMQMQAGANKPQMYTGEVQTSTHTGTTYSKIHVETDQKNDFNIRKQTPYSSSYSELQVHKKSKMPEYTKVQTQSHGGSEREARDSLEMTPVRLCRKELRQISVADLQVSSSATRQRQSLVNTSSESVLEDSIEVPRNTIR